MKKIKKGDIVSRKSYEKDIIFYVKRIIKTPKEEIAILCGLIDRIEADSNIQDLELVDKRTIELITKREEERNIKKIEKKEYKIGIIEKDKVRQNIVTGKILHLDGELLYEKSIGIL